MGGRGRRNPGGVAAAVCAGRVRIRAGGAVAVSAGGSRPLPWEKSGSGTSGQRQRGLHPAASGVTEIRSPRRGPWRRRAASTATATAPERSAGRGTTSAVAIQADGGACPGGARTTTTRVARRCGRQPAVPDELHHHRHGVRRLRHPTRARRRGSPSSPPVGQRAPAADIATGASAETPQPQRRPAADDHGHPASGRGSPVRPGRCERLPSVSGLAFHDFGVSSVSSNMTFAGVRPARLRLRGRAPVRPRPRQRPLQPDRPTHGRRVRRSRSTASTRPSGSTPARRPRMVMASAGPSLPSFFHAGRQCCFMRVRQNTMSTWLPSSRSAKVTRYEPGLPLPASR